MYPEAIVKMPMSPFWAIIFFLMLITLGLDSQFAGVECLLTSLIDQFPNQLRHRKKLVIFSMCTFMFFVSLCMCTNGGVYILTVS